MLARIEFPLPCVKRSVLRFNHGEVSPHIECTNVLWSDLVGMWGVTALVACAPPHTSL